MSELHVEPPLVVDLTLVVNTITTKTNMSNGPNTITTREILILSSKAKYEQSTRKWNILHSFHVLAVMLPMLNNFTMNVVSEIAACSECQKTLCKECVGLTNMVEGA